MSHHIEILPKASNKMRQQESLITMENRVGSKLTEESAPEFATFLPLFLCVHVSPTVFKVWF